mmetsp:Transcript_7342/g.8819  ORF Transcript_7342/g.8819 Transcript_7342/m.8819 type:complete len:214 (+) Transcript_7342:309-950(+)
MRSSRIRVRKPPMQSTRSAPTTTMVATMESALSVAVDVASTVVVAEAVVAAAMATSEAVAVVAAGEVVAVAPTISSTGSRPESTKTSKLRTLSSWRPTRNSCASTMPSLTMSDRSFTADSTLTTLRAFATTSTSMRRGSTLSSRGMQRARSMPDSKCLNGRRRRLAPRRTLRSAESAKLPSANDSKDSASKIWLRNASAARRKSRRRWWSVKP